MNIKWVPVPNFTLGRPGGYKPLLIVCHIMAGTLAGTRSWFANPSSKVSAHFGVGKRGEGEQYVKISDTAWHAGSVRNPKVELPYPAKVNPNLYTVGIEFEGRPGDVFPEEQYQTGLQLIQDLLKQMEPSSLPIKQRVIGHYQINSVGRADCPGPSFPWERLYKDLDPASQLTGPGVYVPETGHFFPVILVDGRMYTPVRGPFEDLGYHVDYDSKAQIATIRR